MTTRTSTFLKLFVLAALLWVQALQVDHVTDEALDSQHNDCVVCKSIGDAAPNGGAVALQIEHNYTEKLAEAYLGQPLQTVLYREHPARAPPLTS